MGKRLWNKFQWWGVAISLLRCLFYRGASILNHEQNFRFIYRTYLAPVCLHKIFPNVSQLCFKCKSNIGTAVIRFGAVTWSRCTGNKYINLFRWLLVNILLYLSLSIYPLKYKAELHLNHDLECVLHVCTYRNILLLWSTPHVPYVDESNCYFPSFIKANLWLTPEV